MPLSANASVPEPGASALTPATRALIASLGQPAPARTAFAEARFMHVLDRPLVISGELAWLGGDHLERQVRQPRPELASIAGGKVTLQRAGKRARHFSLSRAPQLQVLLDSFVALLSGDANRLATTFTIRRSGTAAQWQLTLVPRDAHVAGSVASIEVDGAGRQSRCMRVHQANGDLAVDLLGPLAAKMPTAPTRESLQVLCRGGS